jgi:acetyl esterase
MTRIFIALAALGFLIQPRAVQDVTPRLELEGATTEVYKTASADDLYIYIFVPQGHDPALDRRPAAVFFFGGGWNSGSPTQFEQHARYLASRGMVAAVADYRVKSRQGTSPKECVADGKSAVRYLRQHAQRLGVDPKRIAAGGGSAGGHVAACTGTLPGLDDPADDSSISSRSNALLLFNPVYDNGPDGGYGHERVSAYWKDISPAEHIDARTPPAIVFLGEQDALIPISTAERFQERMKAAGVRSVLHAYPDQAHGFFNESKGGTEIFLDTLRKLDAFLVELGYIEGQPNEELIRAASREFEKEAQALQSPPPPPNFSHARGVRALTETTRRWREERECVSCHTNGWGLVAQTSVAPDSEEVAAGRSFAAKYLEKYIAKGAKPVGQYGSVEGVVSTAAFLAMSDARSEEGLGRVTARALDRAWQLLDKSGTWEKWLQCNWPPFESDPEFGPTLVLVALGELGQLEKLRVRDRRGARKLIKYLEERPPQDLHSKAMRIWAAVHWPNLIEDDQSKAWIEQLEKAQDPDGGWSMSALSGPAWKRDGGGPQLSTSEAYPTAFSVYVLQRTGAKPDDPVVSAGLRWLREHQREEGDWYTRSPRRDGKHYISRTATAFALMALASKPR